MRTVVPVKLTQPENDLLDWLVLKLGLESRSQAIRLSVIEMAREQLAPAELLKAVVKTRAFSRPRRSAKYARLLGPRRRGENGGELEV